MGIIAVVGYASGVGTSTLAGNIAILLQNTGKTLLIERSGKADLLNTIGLAEKMLEGDYPRLGDWIKGDLIKSSNGLAILPGTEENRPIDNEKLQEIMSHFKTEYEHIVIDIGAIPNRQGLEDILLQSNIVKILVTEPSERCLVRKNLPIDSFNLVINRVSSNNICHPRDIERRFNVGINQSFKIPEDIGGAKKSVQSRIPIAFCSKKVGKAYEDIVLSLIGEDVTSPQSAILSWISSKLNKENNVKSKAKPQIITKSGQGNLKKQSFEKIKNTCRLANKDLKLTNEPNEIQYDKGSGEEIDHLTGCHTRASMDKFLGLQTGTYSIIFCDLDHFKLVNDTYGHSAGDEILRQFGYHLTQLVRRRSDRIFRYGGDEFVIFLKDMDFISAKALVHQIMESWNQKRFEIIENKSLFFSGGLAQSGLHGNTLIEVLEAADNALYQVKRSGRGKVQVAEKDKKNIRVKKDIAIPEDTYVAIQTDVQEVLVNYINAKRSKKNRKLTVIDINPESTLAFRYNIDQNIIWQCDWRIGITAKPVCLNKNAHYYGMDKAIDTPIDDRDIRSLKDVISMQQGRQVIAYFGENQMGILENLLETGFQLIK